jgi:hypothetical protein
MQVLNGCDGARPFPFPAPFTGPSAEQGSGCFSARRSSLRESRAILNDEQTGACSRRLYLEGMEPTHQGQVETLLTEAAAEHADLMSRLPPELRASLPVDAQGVTRAIDHVAAAAGLSVSERRALVRPHAVTPAVMHARVFGGAPLARETVIGSFVEGARVRAEALAALADRVGGEPLGREVRAELVAHPPPVGADGHDAVPALRATYAAHERAALMIAASLDGH